MSHTETRRDWKSTAGFAILCGLPMLFGSAPTGHSQQIVQGGGAAPAPSSAAAPAPTPTTKPAASKAGTGAGSLSSGGALTPALAPVVPAPATAPAKANGGGRLDGKPIAQSAPTAPAAKVATTDAPYEVASEETPTKPGYEGVKVHGHWVLQVKNADGTLGERREFENSLTTRATTTATEKGVRENTGDQFLGLLLSGYAVAGDPAVIFSNNATAGIDPSSECFPNITTEDNYGMVAGTPACGALITSNGPSFFGSEGLLASGSTVQTGLTAAVTTTPAVTWVLSGTYTVVSGQTQIGTVETLMSVCTPKLFSPYQIAGIYSTSRAAAPSPATCDLTDYQANTGGGSSFYVGTLTSTLVPNGPVIVTPGQLVQVTVTISFS